MRLSIAFLVLLGFFLPNQASALTRDRQLATSRITDSLNIASKFWYTPLQHVKVYSASPAELTEAAGHPVLGFAYLGIPEIWLSTELEEKTFEARTIACTFIVHETGHVLYHQHSAAERSVMNERLSSIVWPCFRRFVPKRMYWWWKMMYDNVWSTRE